ncbi:MAG: hypothetical protein H0V34_06765 [Gammaproteobacteria bacterium]|nr:hypothetical protein [Gammaproteobacteria bacterium]
MKILHLPVVTILLVVGTSAEAQWSDFDTNPAYDTCILEHLRGAKLDLASQLITNACYENYEDSSLMSDEDHAYNQCLLDYLPGVESITAALQIRRVCARRFYD